ncbi:pleckstrin homology domain-containing family H member 2-like [Lingula anatina]|uniref:Pleckstrin homology domain-containing family H member 2-like n=1 Tax=Lingula anatina TaxID=7574 RepID=A0A1S3HE69_LINAN|nr:pleckstrin homology domain-containing family H member 2-like [Lingula anatina]|eukprot:XP_013383364.1 pleckstrin homology domain-containing family H member 2-like [Lingula anatina]
MEPVDWEGRCLALEMSLQKFQEQANRVRHSLAKQMESLSDRCQEAEKKAQLAEQQVKLLEKQLQVQPGQESELRIQAVYLACREKDKIIYDLQRQVEEQKHLRDQDAKIIQGKVLKIKESIAGRLKELEEENSELKQSSATLTEQVDVLRSRLQSLPASAAKIIYRAGLQKSNASSLQRESDLSQASGPPDIPQRPSILYSLRQQEQDVSSLDISLDDSLSLQYLDSDGCMADNESESIQRTPEMKERKLVAPPRPPPPVLTKKVPPPRPAPPRLKIERKQFQEASCITMSSCDSQDILDEGESHENSPTFQPTDSPTTLITGMDEMTSAHSSVPVGPPNSSNTVSLVSTDSHYVAAPSARAKRYHPLLSIFSPNQDVTVSFRHRRYWDRLLSKSEGYTSPESWMGEETDREDLMSVRRSEGCCSPLPPKPPLHRLPSWESRIYALASRGLSVSETALNRLSTDSSGTLSDGLYSYDDMSVPVYATLKGKAAPIRSTPFSGESSSDSSDDSEERQVDTKEHDENIMTVAGPSGTTTTTSISDSRQQMNHSSSGALKRGVSTHSIGSETSGDYAVPPDAFMSMNIDSDSSEPEHKLLKYATYGMNKGGFEKCGYLTKLGGKVKNWKKRWFVLQNGELLYYKTPNDIVRRPQGIIGLDGTTKILKSQGANTFQIVTMKRTYYLTTNTQEEMDEWIKVMQNVLKRQAANLVLQQTNTKAVMKGWAVKVKNGIAKKCWCVLIGKFLIYSKAPDEMAPMGQVDLFGARIESIDKSVDSDEDSDADLPNYILAIWPPREGPIYLVLPTKREKDSWLYHLTVASGGGLGNVGNIGTESEQLIAKLMAANGDPNSMYWKHPLLVQTKNLISSPLTTLPSEQLQRKALDLAQSIHLFINTQIESPTIDYHVTLAQNMLQTCMDHIELQNEMYCQLIRQTSKSPGPQGKTGIQALNILCSPLTWFPLCDAQPTSPQGSQSDLASTSNSPQFCFVQGWQLIALCVSLFLPKQSMLWHLKAHLQRNADPRNEIGQYGVFCQRALERTLAKGVRDARPSRMEILSILLRNPYHHSQPISIPVHLLNGTYQVVSFDGSTTVEEFLWSLNKELGMRDVASSGFALFSDDPTGADFEHCLQTHVKICDVISKWEQVYKEHVGDRTDNSRTVKFTYKNRLYLKKNVSSETERERHLLAYQINHAIVNGKFPVSKEMAVQLASILAQVEFGDFRHPESTNQGERTTPPNSSTQLPVIIERFYPKRYKDKNCTEEEKTLLMSKIAERWASLKGRSNHECVRIYLTALRKWPFFGAELFAAKVVSADIRKVWLAVTDDGVAILEYGTMQYVTSYSYKAVVTFGGCRDDFMLVVNRKQDTSSRTEHRRKRTCKIQFHMPKLRILELTLLLASYINARNQAPTSTRSLDKQSSTSTLKKKGQPQGH